METPDAYNKGMVRDQSDLYPAQGSWWHMRNGVDNSTDGDIGVVGNEPANKLCLVLPYTSIGFIHAVSGRWIVFSTDNTESEIGIFDETLCLYTKLVNDRCLNFSTYHLVTGQLKVNPDCTWQIYWTDGHNPDRTMNVDDIPWRCVDTIVNPGDPNTQCVECIDIFPLQLDCEKIRLAPLITIPCMNLRKGDGGGSVKNGSYMALVAYAVNGQRVTDYLAPSNVQSIFVHNNTGGSLTVEFSNLDTDRFDEFELVIVRVNDNQTSARKIGLYDTHQNRIDVGNISEQLPEVPLNLIPLRSPVFERSDIMQETGGYLLRIGPRTRFDFNYQPLANNIRAKWAEVRYPATYYENGGHNTGYMRDEVYAFFIRWVFNTGDRSSSYHIPGRPPIGFDTQVVAGNDVLEGFGTPRWQVYNTAGTIPNLGGVLPDGGVIDNMGVMGYWESTERYPSDRPDIWNGSAHPWSNPVINFDNDLCGKKIRHHKMPDNATSNHVGPLSRNILILGVFFEGIRVPVDNNGVPIPGIVGYEILRGSREGQRTIVAKGLVNNMRKYDINLDPAQPTFTEDGLYQNYPYNPLYKDPSLTRQETDGGYQSIGMPGNVELFRYSRSHFTFHGPETQFWKPSLTSREMKLYGELSGEVLGNFEKAPSHPRHKLLGDMAFLVAALVGFGSAAIAVKGRRSAHRKDVGFDATTFIAPLVGGIDPGIAINAGLVAAFGPAKLIIENLESSLIANVLPTMIVGTNANDAVTNRLLQFTTSLLPGVRSMESESTIEEGEYASMPPLMRVLGGTSLFSNYWSMGADSTLNLIRAIVPFTQYAMRYISHGFSNKFAQGNAQAGNTRRRILDAVYIDNSIENLGTLQKVNNLFRGTAVALELGQDFADPSIEDTTLQTIGTASGAINQIRVSTNYGGGFIPNQGLPFGSQRPTFAKPEVPFKTTTCSYYAGIKVSLPNQYGQLDSILQMPTGCVHNVSQLEQDTAFTTNQPLARTEVIFGGDIYITRYTEKNTFFYFSDWLYQQPDGYEYDYRLRYMITYPRFWMDSQNFEAAEFLQGFMAVLQGSPWTGTPSKKARLDGDTFISSALSPIQFLLNPIASVGVKNRYFYLFQSAVRDFFVESEINTAQRDWGDLPQEKHYDPYGLTDLRALFDTPILKNPNFYRYDRSLSVSRLFINFFSWGSIQPRDYDPVSAENCHTYYPKRIIYSLPNQLESKKDYWRVYLANNYKDFSNLPVAVKSVNKSGALILFKADSPVEFQGVDSLQTDLGTKVTIGDGGLFSQPMQSIMNADISYEYGSCQDQLSAINTAAGLFWVSQNQGKIFQVAGGVEEISRRGIKWWLQRNLPFRLTEDFPTFSLQGNPVSGIGVQCIYDNQDEILYICKKDWKFKPGIPETLVYLKDDQFRVNNQFNVPLGDGRYFDSASWTLSYNTKTKAWISFHDWHPTLLIPSKNNFLSVLKSSIWRHGNRTDLYCNFYGVQYPWEVAGYVTTAPRVESIRSVEYVLESRLYNTNNDFFSVPDSAFDEAILFNNEQCSGQLQMFMTPKDDLSARAIYPVVLLNGIRVLFDLEEHKTRFNQFWDVVKDAGEFSTAQIPIFTTDLNGYSFSVNPAAVNYQKSQFQRKKLRSNILRLFLRKRNSGKIKMLLKLTTVKSLESKR
jgi:hypothetical protein